MVPSGGSKSQLSISFVISGTFDNRHRLLMQQQHQQQFHQHHVHHTSTLPRYSQSGTVECSRPVDSESIGSQRSLGRRHQRSARSAAPPPMHSPTSSSSTGVGGPVGGPHNCGKQRSVHFQQPLTGSNGRDNQGVSPRSYIWAIYTSLGSLFLEKSTMALQKTKVCWLFCNLLQ